MCGFTKEGYKSEKLGFVRFTAPMEDIKPDLIDELSKSEATGWSIFLLNRKIEEMNSGLLCNNEPLIKNLIREELNKTPKRIRDKIIPKIKDAFIVVTFILVLLQAFGLVK